MVKRPPAVAVRLVDVRAVLQQELAGRQRVLASKQCARERPRLSPGALRATVLTTDTACIKGVPDSSETLTQLTSAPWASASAMTGKFCRAAERYSRAPGWSPLRSSSDSSAAAVSSSDGRY